MIDLLPYLPYITASAAVVGTSFAVYAALNARSARIAAEKATHGVAVVDGKVYDLGKAVDGRLSLLLKTNEEKAAITADLARSEGHAAGEQQQRDRASEKQP